MAGKRAATTELNDRNWDQEEEPEEAGVFQQADADTLKNRVIKKAKRRGAANDDEKSKSVFSGFGGFGAKSAAPASTTGAFDFLSGSSATSGGGAASNGDKKSASSGFTFGSSSSSNGNGTKSPIASAFTFGAKPAETPKANFSFGSGTLKVDGDKAASNSNSNSIFGKSSDSGTSSFFGNFSSSKSTDTKTSEDEDSKASKPSSTGFTFGGLTKTDEAKKTNSDLSSVAEKEEKDVSSKQEDSKASPSSVSTTKAESVTSPPKGPSGGFDFGGLKKPASTGSGGSWSCDTCMVSNPADKDSCVCCETPKPGAAPKKKAAEPAASAFQIAPRGGFRFGATPASDTSKTSSGFSFGSSASSTSVAPTSTGFKFGGSSSEKKEDKAPGGGFSFGSGKSTSDDNEKTSPAKGHGAKVPSSSGDQKKEYLSHLSALNKQFAKWISQNVEQDSLVLLTPCIKDYEKHLEELRKKYGDLSTAEKTENKVEEPPPPSSSTKDKPLLGAFFASKSPAVEKPAEEKPQAMGFSFGTKKPESSAFSFGNSAAKASTETASTGFSFGAKSSDKPPAASTFSFGTGAAPSEPPKAGFSFGTGTSKLPAFNAGSSMFGAAAAKAMEVKKDEAEDDGADEDQPPKVEVTSVVEEDSIHSVRCKLFYKKDKEFVDKGLGMLHLKKVDGGKVQMLIRAETNLGNILLNIFLNQQMNLVKRGNNLQFACVPNPPIAGIEGPVMMLVKVKNADMAAILEEKVKELV